MITYFSKFYRITLVFSIGLLVFSSCRVTHLPGTQRGEWYISSEANVAVKFDEDGSGTFLNTDRAVADPERLRAWRLGNTYRLRMDGRPNIRGRLTSETEQFQLTSGRAGELNFRKYLPPQLPQGPFRYKDEIFPTVNVVETVYGHAPGYYSSKVIEKRDNKSYWKVLFDVAESVVFNVRRGEIPLHMDIYQPVGDTLAFRPLVVLLHGGAFIAGDKRDELVTSLARDYARRGFVVASVNYRLGYIFLPGRYSNLERAMFSALQDVRAALRYMSFYREHYRIDPHTVFLGGNSAGGILSLKTAFMDDPDAWASVRGSTLRWQSDLGCIDCSTNDLFGPFTIQGVINMWGAIDNLSLLKPHNNIPVLSIHGDNDLVVPYGHDFPFGNVSTRVSAFFSRRIHGSGSIDQYARAMGLNHTLYTFEGLGHEPHFTNMQELIPENYRIIHDQIITFINQQLFQLPKDPEGPFIVGPDDPVAAYFTSMPNVKEVSFYCNDCLVLYQGHQSARIVWIGGKDGYELTLIAHGPHGQVITQSYQIEIREP